MRIVAHYGVRSVQKGAHLTGDITRSFQDWSSGQFHQAFSNGDPLITTRNSSYERVDDTGGLTGGGTIRIIVTVTFKKTSQTRQVDIRVR